MRSTLVITLAGLAAAHSPIYRSFPRGPGHETPLVSRSFANSLSFASGSCDAGEVLCDTDYCMPSSNTCCHDGLGQSCPSGTYCDTLGCCENGKTCSGPPVGCRSGEKECGSGCIPDDGICCGFGYCDPGETCEDGLCSGSGSSSGGSGGSGGSSCLSNEESCENKCMPKGADCCGDGTYCDPGTTCNGDGTCHRGSSGGSGGSGGSSDTTYTLTDYTYEYTSYTVTEYTDTYTSFTELDFTSTETSFSFDSIPTADSSSDSSSTTTTTSEFSVGTDSSGSSSGGSTGSAGHNVPNFGAGLLALIPALLL